MRHLYFLSFRRHIGLDLKYFKGVTQLLVFDIDIETLFIMLCMTLVGETDEMGR